MHLKKCLLTGGYPPTTATGGYPGGYGGLNSASGGLPPPAPPTGYPPTSSNTPYPPTTASSLSQQSGGTGTITQEHIHASLYSAVEDKVKKHLREVLAQSQVKVGPLSPDWGILLEMEELGYLGVFLCVQVQNFTAYIQFIGYWLSAFRLRW